MAGEWSWPLTGVFVVLVKPGVTTLDPLTR
jgi:hypothetical protein